MNIDTIDNLIEQHANDSQIKAWDELKKEISKNDKFKQLSGFIRGYKEKVVASKCDDYSGAARACDDITIYMDNFL